MFDSLHRLFDGLQNDDTGPLLNAGGGHGAFRSFHMPAIPQECCCEEETDEVALVPPDKELQPDDENDVLEDRTMKPAILR